MYNGRSMCYICNTAICSKAVTFVMTLLAVTNVMAVIAVTNVIAVIAVTSVIAVIAVTDVIDVITVTGVTVVGNDNCNGLPDYFDFSERFNRPTSVTQGVSE